MARTRAIALLLLLAMLLGSGFSRDKSDVLSDASAEEWPEDDTEADYDPNDVLDLNDLSEEEIAEINDALVQDRLDDMNTVRDVDDVPPIFGKPLRGCKNYQYVMASASQWVYEDNVLLKVGKTYAVPGCGTAIKVTLHKKFASAATGAEAMIFTTTTLPGYTGKKVSITVFRGTEFSKVEDLKAIADIRPRKCVITPACGYVHSGFYGQYLSVRDAIHAANHVLATKNHYNTFLVTGHSLGGAVASLYALSLKRKMWAASHHVRLVTFGTARIGTDGLYLAMKKILGLGNVFNIVSWFDTRGCFERLIGRDLVTKIPGNLAHLPHTTMVSIGCTASCQSTCCAPVTSIISAFRCHRINNYVSMLSGRSSAIRGGNTLEFIPKGLNAQALERTISRSTSTYDKSKTGK